MDLPTTEARAGTHALDLLEPAALADLFAAADRAAVEAVAAARAEVASAIDLAAAALAAGGRVILLGAGTSGRLAVMEAAECYPTFSSRQVVGRMAGGRDAFLTPREGAEDDPADGAREVAELAVGPNDLVIGVAASGRTPWTWGALEAAGERGARTVLLSCSPASEAVGTVDLRLTLATGPEVLTGSTRLKAGTATKCALNAITTGAFARQGKVFDDLMVDVSVSNVKLQARAARIVSTLAPAADAAALLAAADNEVKTAIVMGRVGIDAAAARDRLAAAGGHLRRALGSVE